MQENNTLGNNTLYSTPFSRAYWRQAASEFKNTRMLVFAALMIALRVALKPVIIPVAADLNISIQFIVNAFGAMVFGPVVAIPAAAITDTLGCILFPTDVYYFPFIFTEIAGSLVFALFLYRAKITTGRLFLAKFCVNFFVNIVLQTPIMQGYYVYTGRGAIYQLFDWVRIAKNLVMLPIEAVVLVVLFRAVVPPVQRLGYVKSSVNQLELTKRHVILLSALFLAGTIAVAGYAVYDYNHKSFSASYSAKERLERNMEMNAWVAQDTGAISEDDFVTVIQSARSKVGDPQMVYELSVYKLDWDRFRAKEGTVIDEKKGTVYTLELVHGYSRSPASKDDALILEGTGTAVTNKHTGEHLSLDIRWLNAPEEGDAGL